MSRLPPLPKCRDGSWRGGDTRTLYTFTDTRTGKIHVLPGAGEGRLLSGIGPACTVAIATRNEATAHWQDPLHVGWTVTSNPTRRYDCHCCGQSFGTDKPHDPQRDTGFGTCAHCRDQVAASWVKHGFPGVTDLASAYARLDKYA